MIIVIEVSQHRVIFRNRLCLSQVETKRGISHSKEPILNFSDGRRFVVDDARNLQKTGSKEQTTSKSTHGNGGLSGSGHA